MQTRPPQPILQVDISVITLLSIDLHIAAVEQRQQELHRLEAPLLELLESTEAHRHVEAGITVIGLLQNLLLHIISRSKHLIDRLENEPA